MSTTDFRSQDAQDPETPLYCANHPNEETYVRCSRCEKPICARCRVRTPVGFRCFDCANLQVLPLLARGQKIADMVASLGSIDIVLGDVDR